MVLILLQVLLSSLRVLGFAPFTAHLADKVKKSREILMLFLSLTFISHAQTQYHIRRQRMPWCASRLPNLKVLSQKALHVFARAHGAAANTDADLEEYLLLSGAPKALMGHWHQAGVWLVQSSRMGGHQHTPKVSSFQNTWQCILYPRLFSSAVWYFLGNFSTKIAVAVTKMHQKLFNACYLLFKFLVLVAWARYESCN